MSIRVVIIILLCYNFNYLPCAVLQVVGDPVFVEEVDRAAADGDVYDADSYVIGQFVDQLAPEVVAGAQAVVVPAKRGGCGVPGILGALGYWHWTGCHCLETGVYEAVLVLDLTGAFHVRLPEGEENVEVGVLLEGEGEEE